MNMKVAKCAFQLIYASTFSHNLHVTLPSKVSLYFTGSLQNKVQSKLDFTDLDFTYNLDFTYFFLRTDFTNCLQYLSFFYQIRFYVQPDFTYFSPLMKKYVKSSFDCTAFL